METRKHWLVLIMDDNLGVARWSSYHDEGRARLAFHHELEGKRECDCFYHQVHEPQFVEIEWGCTEHAKVTVTQHSESGSSVSFPTPVVTSRELLGYTVSPCCWTEEGACVA